MKNALLTLLAAVVLLAAVLFLDHHRDVSRLSEKFAFDTTQKADIVSLRVILQQDTALLLKRDGQWVSARDTFPVDTAKMGTGLSHLLRLQDKIIVSSNPDRLAEYGLDTAEAKHVEWKTNDGRVFQIVFGKTSGIDYSSTYWKMEGRPDIYSTPGNFTWEIASRSLDWKDHHLYAPATQDVKDIRVDWRDSTGQQYHYRLEDISDTGIRLVEPESAAVVKNLAQPLLSRFTQLTIDDFVAPGDTNLREAGLDTPRVDIKMDLKNGNSYEIKGGRTFSDFVYVQHPFRKEVVKLSSWRLAPFEKTPGQLSGRDTAQIPEKPVEGKSRVKKVRS